ncbi:FxsA family protein [Modestobacter roseus]|nr:FxsA family protein [Modestobacter roseus]
MGSAIGGHTPRRRASSRWRTAVGLGALAEVVVFVLVASWIGVGWTLLLALATSALGGLLLARQGTRALTELRLRAEEHRAPGRALGDAGLVALGGLLMVLPGFIGDVLGLMCLLPGTRALPRALIARGIAHRLPARWLGPVRVQATRTVDGTVADAPSDVRGTDVYRAGPAHRVIEGRVVEGRVVEGEVEDGPSGR